uniref:CN hydrolase domain-containing protein n=1 Tax=Elaeophora elaphi TaxID=1147741 RepID=A0A0R3RGW7_9BILA
MKIPLGFVNEKNKWMQIRDGQKNDSGIVSVEPSLAVLQIGNDLKFEAATKKEKYAAVVCEHRNSALSVIENRTCGDGFVLLAINNASKCYLFHEFEDPLIEGNSFEAVSSYCRSQNAELFDPVDSGDLYIMQKIGEASGYAVSASSKQIHRQYGYINQKVRNNKEEPMTAAGYKYSIVGVRLPFVVAQIQLKFDIF